MKMLGSSRGETLKRAGLQPFQENALALSEGNPQAGTRGFLVNHQVHLDSLFFQQKMAKQQAIPKLSKDS